MFDAFQDSWIFDRDIVLFVEFGRIRIILWNVVMRRVGPIRILFVGAALSIGTD